MTPPPFATLQLPPIFPLYLTAISLPGLTVRCLAGWDRVVQGYTSSVQSVTATSLSFSTGLWATSYSAETFAILHALEWCISHSKACNFDSITFFSDSLSVVSTLSTPLPYLTPQFLSNTQSLLNSLSQSKVIHLQWIPGHSSLPGNDLADSLAKVGAPSRSLQYTSIPHTPYLLPTTIPLHQLETQCPIWFLSSPNPYSISRGAYSPSLRSLCSLPFTLQRAQHSPQLLSPQGWSSRDSFLQQLWF